MLVKTAGLSLLAICALAASSQQQTAPPPREAAERGALAILRRDGIIFPFASFNRDSWRLTWPVGRDALIPPTIGDVPDSWWGTRTPELWNAYLYSGEVRPIELRAPVLYRTFCMSKIGLRTTYQSALPLPPTPGDPFPKDGIAISGYARLEPIETVPPTSAEWKPLETSLAAELDRAEAVTLRGVHNDTGWRHPLKEEERRAVPFRLESWYRSPGAEPGWTVSYVEAVRKYPPRPEDKGCGLETIVSGWVHHASDGQMSEPQLRGKIAYCDRVGVAYMLPFGRIRPRDQSYWIYQLSGWDDERYEVTRIERGKVRLVIEVPGGRRGACP
ncbi:MAG TPA: hypothetical protein VH740_05695 [Vicinamibacterales bacterium]